MFFRKRALARIANEKVLYERRRGGDISVCVIYPNIYRLGMANLGFQAVYHIFESARRINADRAFLPDPDESAAIRAGSAQLMSFEDGRPLTDFEIVAFSIAFETDYLNVLNILRMAGIPLRRSERAGRNYPLIIAGGSAVFLNPEPIADFIDLFLIGEGEEMVPEFLAAYERERETDSAATTSLESLAQVGGAYLPDYFHPDFDDSGRISSIAYYGPGDARVKRRMIRDLDRFTTASLILTDESVFGDMYLVEASRGCQWGCRFCAAGFMYRPIRYRSPKKLIDEAARGLTERRVIGLIGAEMASVPGVAEVANAVADSGGRLSPSSLKADCISPQLAAALKRNGSRSVTVAPEAGSERMRKVINKNLTEPQIVEASAMLAGEGIENLKLYFMIGLPEEQDQDVVEIARLTGKILHQVRTQRTSLAHVTVSLNPFVPKPWTPFQWDPMEDAQSIKRKVALLRTELRHLGGSAIELDAESPREAYFQTLVSRGDRRVGGILERLSAVGCDQPGSIWQELRRMKHEAIHESGLPDPDSYVTRSYAHDEILPWDFIDHHIHKWFLLSERKKA
ncbi:MAG TPA: radical SAM protein, partial [Candidatus Binataceae bacterium]|nr:radical SAM protein [Candidatus Binataceae bacterium]